MIEINVFGPTTVTGGGSWLTAGNLGGSKPRQVLEMLAIDVGAPVSKETLAERLWDGNPPRCYIATLESYVCGLRRRLSPVAGDRSPLLTSIGGYVLDDAEVVVDIVDVRRMLASPDLATVSRTVAIVDEMLLADEPFAPWAAQERERFATCVGESYVRAARQARVAGDPELAATLAGSATRCGSYWSEPAAQELMQALAESGNRSQALVEYQNLRDTMREDLGIDPSPETQAIYLEILRADAVRPDDELSLLLGLLKDALEAGLGRTSKYSASMTEVGNMLLAQN